MMRFPARIVLSLALAIGPVLGDDAVERFFEVHAGRPCPALDPETGTCDLYAWRPVSCRTFGPPVRFGAEDLPPCRVCFVDCGPAEIETFRAEPDPEDLEGARTEFVPGGDAAGHPRNQPAPAVRPADGGRFTFGTGSRPERRR